MNSAEIRQFAKDAAEMQMRMPLEEKLKIWLLAEIAAQLAEHNARATEPEIEALRAELRKEILNFKNAANPPLAVAHPKTAPLCVICGKREEMHGFENKCNLDRHPTFKPAVPR